MFYSAVRAHGGLVIADEVSLEYLSSFPLNSFSESNWSWEDWRTHVGLSKFWSSSGYSHDRPFHVQWLSNGRCDMFKVLQHIFQRHLLIFQPGRCLSDLVDTSLPLVEIQLPAPLDSPSWRWFLSLSFQRQLWSWAQCRSLPMRSWWAVLKWLDEAFSQVSRNWWTSEKKIDIQALWYKKFFRHECLGDIRGSGLIWAIEIVNNKRENKPVSRNPPLSTFFYCSHFRNQSWPQK